MILSFQRVFAIHVLNPKREEGFELLCLFSVSQYSFYFSLHLGNIMATGVNLILNCLSRQCRRNLDTSFGMKRKAFLQWMSSVGPLLNSVFLHILNVASTTANSFSAEHVG